MDKDRKLAIHILEAISEMFGDEDIFDSQSYIESLLSVKPSETPEPDGTWYKIEDKVTEIIKLHREVKNG